MKIPEEDYKDGMTTAKHSDFKGVSWFDLSRGELIALAALGWSRYNQLISTKQTNKIN